MRIPGPTPLPDEVLEAMNREMISHRGAEFHELMREVTERLKHCFQTEGDVLVFPAAGDLAKSHKYKVFKDSSEEDEWNSIFQPIYSS